MMSCGACNRLTLERLNQRACDHPAGSRTGWNQPGYLIFHLSFNDLIASASSNCPNCLLYRSHFYESFGGPQLVLKNVRELESSGLKVPVIAFLATTKWGADLYITKLQLQIGTQPWKAGDDGRMTIAFRISQPRSTIHEPSFQNLKLRYTGLDHDLGSDVNFQIARDWLQDCCKKHDAALCPPAIDHQLPTRVIDVGSKDGFEDPKLILSSAGQKGQYVALSHCWGSIKGIRLVTTGFNLKSHQTSIPIITMPANFRDAVIVTRKLGFRYLWIDSLCIIQDSARDWEFESARMGDIYMNACLTIAAAAAMNSDGGMLVSNYDQVDFKKFEPTRWFLIDRKKTNNYALAEPSSVKRGSPNRCIMSLDRDPNSLTVSLTPWSTYSDLEENWFRCVVVGPLGHRGWTLQERTLSHRTLYYGSRQIYWQCSSSRKAADGEDVPISASTSVHNLSSDHSEWPDLLGLQRVDGLTDLAKEQLIYQTWRTILTIYVSRRLTKQTDKLPALAGMASIIREMTGDQYVAGFWRKDLLVSLVWTSIPIWVKGNAARDYETLRVQWEIREPFLEGPSWSWSAVHVEDRLDFWGAQEDNRLWKSKDAEIKDVNLEYLSSNPLMRVESGRLTIHGYTYERRDGRQPFTLGSGSKDLWSDYTCFNSAKHVNADGVALWDYTPRHRPWFLPRISWFLSQLVVLLFLIFFWPRAALRHRLRLAHDITCPYCPKYLSLHILSIVSMEQRFNLDTGQKHYEVGLWSLILEPVRNQENTYRRIGIARKDVVISEPEYLTFKGVNGSSQEPKLSTLFQTWEKRTVVII
ncbi:heterokaryon incompatibility protein [Phlyctema vagabunda]|uniref:Heterokaryon incompatibility protein n=1 Tax=Phlyctema vagabunda TaxID=108571 RepID=A0ABR4PAR0_9HELO